MFNVYDYYEDCEYIGTASTYKEACMIAKQHNNDTGGKCEIIIYDVKREIPIGWYQI